MSGTVRETCLQLTGTVGSSSIVFDLPEGEYAVGALEGSDIFLPVSGVSRKHAVLRVLNNEIVVEDAGSKNGTYVNGQRLQRAVVRPGDWVGFGPAILYVVEIDCQDAEVAINLDAGPPSANVPPAEEDTETRVGTAYEQPLLWVSLLNELAAQLIGEEDPDPALALSIFLEETGAKGACLVEWDDKDEPLVLCTSGEPFDLPNESPVRSFIRAVADAGKSEGVVLSKIVGDGPPLAWAAAASPGMAPCALVIRGEFPNRIASGPLLEAVLRMILHARSEPIHLGAEVEPAALPELHFGEGHVRGRSAAMQAVHEQVRQLLRGDIPVLITGETGVGKELIARLIHASSQRRKGPFVAINCAAIPSELLEAELFGIERGVATGVQPRQGKFQQAGGGILFLDEIADMSADLQAKLLRALQAMEISPVGGRQPVPVDVRILSATNTNLQERLADGRFRRDLYYRIAGFVLRVPPLRERREDIPLLVEHFMRRYAEEVGKPIRGITVKALHALVNAGWPGNVRELEHEVRRLVYLCPEGRAIDSRMISGEILYACMEMDLDSFEMSPDLRLETRVDELERKLITVALARTRGNRSKAAKLLGISRNGLALKMERLGLK